jgi:hypothetical protein
MQVGQSSRDGAPQASAKARQGLPPRIRFLAALSESGFGFRARR